MNRDGCVKMKKSKTILIFVFVLGAVLNLSGCKLKKATQQDADMAYLMKLIKEHSYYFDEEKLLDEGAFRGIVGALGDPYSDYFNEEEYADFKGQISGNFAGVGISVVKTGNYTLIANVIENSPAETAGLKRGDVILEIDGSNAYDKLPSEIAGMIRGEINTSRTIKVARGNLENVVTIEVTIKSVTSQSIDYQVFKEGNQVIGYVQITGFSGETFKQFKDAIVALEKSNITDIILDVRNNPGGSLNTVLDMLDYLIDTDKPLMYSRNKKGEMREYAQDKFKTTVDYDVMVLINENSASASEIFAATLNEIAGYPLIGKTTYGKGTMQGTFLLNVGQTTAVKLTIENWLTPNKKSIQGIGVAPTTEVNWPAIYQMSYLDYLMELSVDTVNLEAIYLQTFFQNLGYEIRNDGYVDQKTINALIDYQTKLQTKYGVSFTELGKLDFMSVYYLNQAVIEMAKDLTIDVQFQAAFDMALTN
jgi:carboxyl-terminal processing protease